MNPNRQKMLEISTPKGKIIVRQMAPGRYYVQRYKDGKIYKDSSFEVTGNLDRAQSKALQLARTWLMVREIGIK